MLSLFSLSFLLLQIDANVIPCTGTCAPYVPCAFNVLCFDAIQASNAQTIFGMSHLTADHMISDIGIGGTGQPTSAAGFIFGYGEFTFSHVTPATIEVAPNTIAVMKSSIPDDGRPNIQSITVQSGAYASINFIHSQTVNLHNGTLTVSRAHPTPEDRILLSSVTGESPRLVVEQPIYLNALDVDPTFTLELHAKVSFTGPQNFIDFMVEVHCSEYPDPLLLVGGVFTTGVSVKYFNFLNREDAHCYLQPATVQADVGIIFDDFDGDNVAIIEQDDLSAGRRMLLLPQATNLTFEDPSSRISHFIIHRNIPNQVEYLFRFSCGDDHRDPETEECDTVTNCTTLCRCEPDTAPSGPDYENKCYPACSPNCEPGNCTALNECAQCRPGFRGTNCEYCEEGYDEDNNCAPICTSALCVGCIAPQTCTSCSNPLFDTPNCTTCIPSHDLIGGVCVTRCYHQYCTSCSGPNLEVCTGCAGNRNPIAEPPCSDCTTLFMHNTTLNDVFLSVIPEDVQEEVVMLVIVLLVIVNQDILEQDVITVPLIILMMVALMDSRIAQNIV
jgi:hypothetical protein